MSLTAETFSANFGAGLIATFTGAKDATNDFSNALRDVGTVAEAVGASVGLYFNFLKTQIQTYLNF